MKSVLGKYAAFAATAALAAACGSVWAQSIPVPASSADSGRRAVVAVTQPDLSSYATKSELTIVDNRVTNVSTQATNAQNTANTANANAQPWAKYFVGTWAASSGCGWRYYIDGNGLLYGWGGHFTAISYTYLNSPITYTNPSNQCTDVVGPYGANGDGGPAGWGVLQSAPAS